MLFTTARRDAEYSRNYRKNMTASQREKERIRQMGKYHEKNPDAKYLSRYKDVVNSYNKPATLNGKVGKELEEAIVKNANASDIVKKLSNSNIEYREVQQLKHTLSEDEIIKRLAGGDMTEGSCASLSFAYAGNKAGYDVLDFRGGESRKFFATNNNIIEIAKLPGVKSTIVEDYNDIKGALNLLKTTELEKEYILSTGKHAAIVKRTETGVSFLELQEPADNGFKKLTVNKLKDRFGCQQTHQIAGIKLKEKNVLIDVESLYNNDEYREILGYINTSKTQQLKGLSGYAK